MDSGSWSSKSGDGDFRTSSITEIYIEIPLVSYHKLHVFRANGVFFSSQYYRDTNFLFSSKTGSKKHY